MFKVSQDFWVNILIQPLPTYILSIAENTHTYICSEFGPCETVKILIM